MFMLIYGHKYAYMRSTPGCLLRQACQSSSGLRIRPDVLPAQLDKNTRRTSTVGGLCATMLATRMCLPSWSSPRAGQSREASFDGG
jgi:hypothetical protein